MKKILKVTYVLGIATLVRLISGVARVKFLAWQLGPVGMGLVGQAQMYSVFTIQLCSLNMALGVTKHISENLAQKSNEKVQLTVNVATSAQFIASLLFIAVVLPFSGLLTKSVLSDQRYWIYFVGITLTTPFALYLIGIGDPIFYGFRKISTFTKVLVLYSLIGLLLLFPMTYLFGIEGVLSNIIVVSLVGFFLTVYYLKKGVPIRQGFSLRLLKDRESWPILSSLFKYGVTSFLPASVGTFLLLYLRGLLMKQYGMEANGYYHVAYAMSAYYLPFMINGLAGHLYPELCVLQEKNDINRELNRFIRFVLFASTAIAGGIIILRRYAILALFSDRFIKAYDLLAIQAIGDIFFMIFYTFSTSLVARRKFKGVILISTIGYNALLLASYLILRNFPAIDFRSLNMAVALTNLTLVVVQMAYWRVDTGFVLSRDNVSVFIKGMIFLAVVLWLPGDDVFGVMMKGAVGIIWLALSITRDEAKGVAELLLAPLRKRVGVQE